MSRLTLMQCPITPLIYEHVNIRNSYQPTYDNTRTGMAHEDQRGTKPNLTQPKDPIQGLYNHIPSLIILDLTIKYKPTQLNKIIQK